VEKIVPSNAKLCERAPKYETIVERYDRRMARGNIYLQLGLVDTAEFDKEQLSRFNAEAEIRRVRGEEC